MILEYADKLVDQGVIAQIEQVFGCACPETGIPVYSEALDALAVLKEIDGKLTITFIACLNEPTDELIREFLLQIKQAAGEQLLYAEMGPRCLYVSMWPDHVALFVSAYDDLISTVTEKENAGIIYWEAVHE